MKKIIILLIALVFLAASCNQKQAFNNDPKPILENQTTDPTIQSTSPAEPKESTTVPQEAPKPTQSKAINKIIDNTSTNSQTQVEQNYTKAEADQQLNSVIDSYNKAFDDRRKLLATLIVAETTLENNINNEIKTITVLKNADDALRGKNYVRDFFTSYVQDQLGSELGIITAIKNDSYNIDPSISQILSEYDQLKRLGAPTLKKGELITYLQGLSLKNLDKEDLIDNAIEKENIAYKQASSNYFSFQKDYYNDIFYYLTGSSFFGYKCLDNCTGHEQGWLWGLSNKISLTALCSGNSESFIEGCYVYVKQN